MVLYRVGPLSQDQSMKWLKANHKSSSSILHSLTDAVTTTATSLSQSPPPSVAHERQKSIPSDSPSRPTLHPPNQLTRGSLCLAWLTVTVDHLHLVDPAAQQVDYAQIVWLQGGTSRQGERLFSLLKRYLKRRRRLSDRSNPFINYFLNYLPPRAWAQHAWTTFYLTDRIIRLTIRAFS